MIGEYRELGRIRIGRVALFGVVYLAGAYGLYRPFFANYVNVGASGVGLVRAGDNLGLWLLIWGVLGFFVLSWFVYRLRWARLGGQPAHDVEPPVMEPLDMDADEDAPDAFMDVSSGEPIVAPVIESDVVVAEDVSSSVDRRPPGQAGVARVWRLIVRRYDRLPRLFWLHRLMVRRATFGYLLWASLPVALVLAGVGAWSLGRAVLGLCLLALALGVPLLWQRREQATGGEHLITLLGVTGLVILAGTQVVYLKDFLQGGDWYRMNTLFKFFIQVWVLWGLAAGMALPRLWGALRRAGPPKPGRRSRRQVGGAIGLARGGGAVADFEQRLFGFRYARAPVATDDRLATAVGHAQRSGVYGTGQLYLARRQPSPSNCAMTGRLSIGCWRMCVVMS